MPEHRPRRLFLEMKQIHLAAEPAMIAPLGLLDLLEITGKLILVGPGGAVDAGEHRVLGIAAPIGARDLHQLEGGADASSRRHVRPAAQVEPFALLVDPDRLALGDRIDQLDLEQLALAAEDPLGLFALPHLLGEGAIARDDLPHLRLDGGKILRRERLIAEEVVIEAVLDDRSDGHLGPGPQGLHGLGEHVGAVVANGLEGTRVVVGEELDARVALDRVGQIGGHSVECHGDRAFGERGRDPVDDVFAGNSVGVFATRPVGESQADHYCLLLARRPRMQVSARRTRSLPASVRLVHALDPAETTRRP